MTPMRKHLQAWRAYARDLKSEVYAISLACRDPRTPWPAKILAACVAGYAFSPIDLIPDFIPIIGYLDDLVLVPLGIALVIRMIPPPVLAECRQAARDRLDGAKPRSWIAAAIIVLIWLVVAGALAMWLLPRMWHPFHHA
jgi:uncharacterized membrane protein YkvA (DUF1232 family)